MLGETDRVLLNQPHLQLEMKLELEIEMLQTISDVEESSYSK